MKHFSIRWRLTLWYGVALTATLCGFCLVLLVLVKQQMFARTDAGLREEVKEIGLEIGLAETAETFASQAKARFSQHDFYKFFVTNESGDIIFATSDITPASAELKEKESAPDQVRFESRNLENLGPYRVASASAPSTFGRLQIQVLRSLEPINADLNSLQLVMAILLPIGGALALFTGHFLAGRALRPVQTLLLTANSIDISCLDRRIEVSNPHDEIGKLATALNSLIARLERAVGEIRRFTADASHEIRTPLAALRSEAELALRSPRSAEEYVRTLGVVVEEATRLGRLADQLLNLSRDDAGIAPCMQDPVQLDALLLDVTDQLRPFANDRGVSLHYDGEGRCEVLGDDIRLSQVFFNIVENAIKYTPRGGRVAVRSLVSDQMAVIEVVDSGIGIPASDLPHVFERFYRVDAARQNHDGGAGLGLSIAKAAVVAHHGTIEVHSEPGQGTSVAVRLPKYSGSEELTTAQTGVFRV